jgi:putative monooxygenase
VPTQTFRIISVDEVTPNTRRGGELRVLLSPSTVGSTSSFMGVAVVRPGERVNEHYHPYSEEYLYVEIGEITLDLDGVPHPMTAGQALMVPRNVRHRLRNTGATTARVVFHLSPLAPRPDLGHVDTEESR